MSEHGRHIPESHPVFQKYGPPQQYQVERMTEVIDEMARYVRRMPNYRLPPVLKDRLKIIAEELLRRAG